MKDTTPSKVKKAGAALGLTGISCTLIWNIYASMDTRVRNVETSSASQSISIQTVDKKLDKVDTKLDKINTSILNLSIQVSGCK